MSALAKIFIIFNFVLSVFFFGSSAVLYLTRADWRTAHTKYRDESQKIVQSLGETLNRLRSENDGLTNDLSQYKGDLNKATTDLKSTVENLASAQQQVEVARAQMSQATIFQSERDKLFNAQVQRNESLTQQLTEANSRRDEALANLDQANEERNTMKLDLDKSQQELSATRINLNELTSQFEEMELKFNYLAKRFPGAVPAKPAPEIEAQIVAVDNGEKLVVLSVGRDQKVEKGHQFTVYRGESFIGKVEVFEVYPDLAGARILFTKDGESIQQNDKASTAILNS